MNQKRFHFELFIALMALMISGVAAAASAYQTYVINKQLSATVWPYVTFAFDSERQFGYYQLDVRNVGLGPAIIRSDDVTVDGKPLAGVNGDNPLDVFIANDLKIAVAEAKRTGHHGLLHTTSSGLTTGDVIPAGSTVTMLRVEGAPLVRRIVPRIQHLDITICYCSLLGQCWQRKLSELEPHERRSCPLPPQ